MPTCNRLRGRVLMVIESAEAVLHDLVFAQLVREQYELNSASVLVSLDENPPGMIASLVKRLREER